MRYWSALLTMKLRGLGREPDFAAERGSIAEYRAALAQHGGKRLEDSRVLEIGFGQRPWRLCWLASLGVDVTGIDLDRPVLRGTPGEYARIFREHGAERALKSLVRGLLFDRRERRALARTVAAETGRPFVLPVDRMYVSDAAAETFWRGLPPLDFIYSEDVFEHIPRAALERIVPAMAHALGPGGLAFIRPCVFTGITGGHDPEWYAHTLAEPRQRRSDPWEHLRRDRFPADTFLNRLTRADYRRLFVEHFEILEESVALPDLGRELLTPDVRKELAQYDEDELLSNNVLFLLRPKP
ncbi:MAG TPA: methyltransferase domain-containing protein [Stellaceae bacterium]|nr:methyltransferase domain-containing protein [Stellaceae bacterium]